MEVFWERGYEATSLGDLTAAMGINSSSLYAAFDSKQSLFREAVELYDATTRRGTDRALAEQPTARAAVEAMLRSSVDLYVQPGEPTGCMIVLAATNTTPGNAAVRDHLAGMRRAAADDLDRRLQRGVAEGDLPPNTDTAALAAYYTTVLQGLSIQSRDGASHEDLNVLVDCAMAAWDGVVASARS
jgi:AcrR family transcriptional regulator